MSSVPPASSAAPVDRIASTDSGGKVTRPLIYALVLLSGGAALSWEVLWQIHASLAIGVSAMGTAITLVATMGGMTLGALVGGRFLRDRAAQAPRLYAVLEIVVGLAGAMGLAPGFRLVEALDSAIYLTRPSMAPLAELAGIVFVLGVPAAAMGATVPVFGLLARRVDTSIATLYGLNTAGAALGVLGVTFALLPALGVQVTAILLACVNLLVATVAWLLPLSERPVDGAVEGIDAQSKPGAIARADLALVLASGFVTLGLEVTWFRSLRAAFWSTTDTFAILLTSVLVPLAFGAPVSRWLSRKGAGPAVGLGVGGILTLCATPLLSRFDIFFDGYRQSGGSYVAIRLFACFVVMGPPMILLGSCLPAVLARNVGTSLWGRAYATNTIGAVAGSLVVAWVLLPALGSERTAWVLGAIVVVVSIAAAEGRARRVVLAVALPAVAVAWFGDSGAGRFRVQGWFPYALGKPLAIEEGPNSTIAVADDAHQRRVLAIDGFTATSEAETAHYMAWMGRLPMMLHPSPSRALVICFGTGQTANAVRKEEPNELDIVELDPGVLRMAGYFSANDDVLHDPRVHPTVMDGRAWLRRTPRDYDVITLEPMPPHFAGVNALYSREFYALVRARLRPGGIAAQWLPFHLLSIDAAAAIVATFEEAFGDAILWVDPIDFSGILLGRVGPPTAKLGREWPGLARPIARDLTRDQLRQAVRLTPAELARWAQMGVVITDDNQRLAYDLHHQGEWQHEDRMQLMLAHAAVLSQLHGAVRPPP